MTRLTARLARHPRWTLAIVAYLTALLIDPGNLGAVDTARRLEITHSLWRGTPAANLAEYPAFAMKTKNGDLNYPYGIGQSLAMLPADIVAEPIANALSQSAVTRLKVRNGLVGVLTFPPICAATIVVAFGFLGRLGFGRRESAAGALALLFGTSLLPYTQVHQENSLLFLLLLLALDSALTWARTGDRRSLVLASCVLGASLLVRVTSVLDAAAVAAVTACVLARGARSTGDGAALRRRIADACLIGVPCFLAFAAVERFYQWWRFGDLTSTYVHVWAVQKQAISPNWPPGFPFSNPFWDGFAGQTIGLYKSVFLFDPLLVLTIAVGLGGWRRMGFEVRCVFVGSLGLLMAYLVFYSRSNWWGGDHAWGNRYTTMPAQLSCLLGVPLLLRDRPAIPKPWYALGLAVVVVSVLVQVESVVLPCAVEVSQHQAWNKNLFAVGQRAINIAGVLTGRFGDWGLSTPVIEDMGWKRTPNFSPYTIRSVFPGRIATMALAAWAVFAIAYAVFLVPALRALLGRERADSRPGVTR